jgi:cystathionine gamma-synthase
MRQHCANARAIAAWLEGHEAVRRVHYPGLPGHPQHALAACQMDDFGGMVSFELDGGEECARAVVEATRIWQLAESLGGVESLIEHPGLMTHASLAGSPFELPGNLVRLSVGIESVEDLVADLDQALARADGRARPG